MPKQSIVATVVNAVIAIVDPEREQRLIAIANALESQFENSDFHLESFGTANGVSKSDLRGAAETLYRRLLDTAWSTGRLPAARDAHLRQVAQSLQLSGRQIARLNKTKVLELFEEILRASQSVGYVDENVDYTLDLVAGWIGLTVRQVRITHARELCDQVIEVGLTRAIADNCLSDDAWNSIRDTARRLEYTDAELRRTVQPVAQRWIARILADAKCDESLSSGARQGILSLMQRLSLPRTYVSCIEDELSEIDQIMKDRQLLEEIAKGRLPSIIVPAPVQIRAGEIAHWHGPARYSVRKETASGTRYAYHQGTATITDYRVIFSSQTKAVTLNLRNIISFHKRGTYLEVRATGGGAGFYRFLRRSQIAEAVFATALGRANQTVVEEVSGPVIRHIPRDVRQRVWQRYGGRCADCGSTQYLEFDHIVPHSKGGSNTDGNVQLLCRACNLKKSDYI